MSAKKQYKQTELGLIPEDWEVKKISKFTQTTAGGTPSTQKNEYWNGDIKWMNSGELNLKKVFNVENKITELGLKNSSTKLIPVKCILIGLAGQGKTRGTVAMNMVELCTNQSIAAIYPNDSFISEFLYYNLDNRYAELRRLSTGDGGRGGLNLKLINSLKIPLPPLPEQKAIADCISTWDCAIEKQSALINALTDRKKALMQQLLTGKKRLPGFSDEWKEVKLGEIIIDYKEKPNDNNNYEILTSSKNGLMKQTDYYGDNRITNRTDADYNVIPNGFITYRSRSDDGLFTFNLNDLGVIGLISGYYPVFSFAKSNTQFLLSFLNYFKSKLIKYAIGTSQLVLSINALKEAKFKLPSLEEQTAIAEILATADRELTLQKEKLAQLQIQKKGLMQVLLTGKKRLLN